MLKPSPLRSKADTLVESTTEAEADSLQDPLQRKPPRVVAISGRRVAVQTPNHATPELLDSCQDRCSEPDGPQKAADAQPGDTAIREELARILASKTFSRAVQMSYLLELVISRWLADETELLDGYHILMAVFHRTKALQTPVDSTGRVYVGRLRAQLERYYEREGAANQLRLEIPIGKYIPIARWHTPSPADNRTVEDSATNTVMVLPFQLAKNCQSNAGPAPLAIMDHLISRLTRTRQIRVTSRFSASFFDYGTDARLLGEHFGARFLVEGTVDQSLEACDLTVHLSETTSGYNIWTGHYQAMAVSLAELSKQIVRDLLRRMKRAVVSEG